jgi:glycosyltransferase involved in cell wall biosynthesis
MRIHLLNPMMCRDGGADVYSEQLAAGLSERGHEVAILCKQATGDVVQRWKTAVLAMPDYDQWPWLWRTAPFLRWRRWRQFIAGLDWPQPDVLISSKGFCSAALVQRFPGVPLVYLPHSRIDPLEIEQMLPPSASWMQRKLACGIAHSGEYWSLLHAATTVRFTAGNVADLRDYYRLPETVRFDVIPPGIVGPAKVPARTTSPVVRLLSIARLIEPKNLSFLLGTLAGLECPDWRLDIVGDGPERAELERLSAEFGLAGKVRFHGFQSNPQRFYADADLHVFPSRLESLGLVVLEAMSHGIPTLAIQADGRRYRNSSHELITHGADGWLARDEVDFARRLHSAVAQPAQLSAVGASARQTFLDRYDWSAVVGRWEALLQEIARAPTSVPQPVSQAMPAPQMSVSPFPEILSPSSPGPHAYAK